MPEAPDYEGSCQCGKVQYSITGKILAMFCCHCPECRKQSGGIFGMALWIEFNAVHLQQGCLSSWRRPVGREDQCVTCEFCADCGTRLFHRMDAFPNIISVKPGTLDGELDVQSPPVAHLWTNNAVPWFQMSQHCLLYPTNPPSFEPLFEAWQARQA